jgi:hypothetical protein
MQRFFVAPIEIHDREECKGHLDAAALRSPLEFDKLHARESPDRLRSRIPAA